MKNLILDNIDFQLYVDTLKKLDSMNYRNKSYYEVLYYWMKNKNGGKSISDYLLEKSIKSIGIYGAGNLGELLFSELKNENKILIKYIIDRSSSNEIFFNTPILKLKQLKNVDKVDCIIVTPIYAFEEIKDDLKKVQINNLLCIDDIIFDIYEE